MDKSKIEKAQEIGAQISKDIQAGKKPTFVNKVMKHFFFTSIKGRSDVKGIEQEIGKLDYVALILQTGKSILRAQAKKAYKDIAMTDEEVTAIYKNFRVKQESIDACKSIFVQLNFNTKNITIQQNKKDGTTSTLTI